MDQGSRAILGRVKSPQGDSDAAVCDGSDCGESRAECQTDRLSEALKQQCAIKPSSSDCRASGKAGMSNESASGGSWNLQASEFVPTSAKSVTTKSTASAIVEAGVTAEAASDFDQNDAALCYELGCALESLAKTPGSFSEEAVNIVSIMQQSVTSMKQALYAADSIVQYAIAYRSFTYDAASLCQNIIKNFRRQFGPSGSTFRDCLLVSIQKEYKQLDSYVAAGARDRRTNEASGDGMWTPYEYRSYVNGLVQFTGFVFMTVMNDSSQRFAALGLAVRSTLITLLRATEVDYLDSVLIVLKECGRQLSELEDADGEWTTLIDTLDHLLVNSQPGASLLTYPSAPPVPETGGVPCLRISAPLRNQLRRFVEQARSWAPSSSSVAANGVSVAAATA